MGSITAARVAAPTLLDVIPSCMFRRRPKPPDTPFVHSDDCKLAVIEPDLQPPWSDLGSGSWRRECRCTFEVWSEPLVDDRAQVDPYDPKTSRHLPQCEFISADDPAVLKVLLTVKPGTGGDYWWVTCAGCEGSRQVPFYAAERAGTG
jgi:hypothetical protein